MQFNIENVEIGDDAGLLAELVTCWRASVAATHTFLTPDDIERIAGYVPDAIASVAHLVVCRDDAGAVAGFLGVDGAMVEMLFIDPALRGRGLGTLLLNCATNEFGATLVDVNEQNDQAIGFYEHFGFRTFDRSETDGMGDPFPILHMRLA
ncbi:GNAT family N-acetyltransferase [Adlercreutzia agrestimuris]|uniref:GNAT family N-acetyltransferase n=1 Tax=Adlercreutzia agrestimuris TaxID=2941324 RepID=UPI00203C7EEF|nr:GNAT family N-acetyltransferase [Adlercreutzia agrestimuris]